MRCPIGQKTLVSLIPLEVKLFMWLALNNRSDDQELKVGRSIGEDLFSAAVEKKPLIISSSLGAILLNPFS